jgi:hypothetical protein
MTKTVLLLHQWYPKRDTEVKTAATFSSSKLDVNHSYIQFDRHYNKKANLISEWGKFLELDYL